MQDTDILITNTLSISKTIKTSLQKLHTITLKKYHRPLSLHQCTPFCLQPDTQKQNAIIEKTAKFIATQGAQMEILIKAKQGDNSQFKFLNKGDELHPYYMALIALVKAGKWPEKTPEVVEGKFYKYSKALSKLASVNT